MADRLPSMPLYAGDWFKDAELSMCCATTRGVWIDLLLRMWNADRCGQITGTIPQLARAARCTEAEMAHALDELGATKAADVTGDSAGLLTVVNRRMRRDYLERAKALTRQRKKRGQPPPDLPPELSRDCHGEVTSPIAFAPSIAASAKAASAACSAPDEPAAEPPPEAPEPAEPAAPPLLTFPTVGKAQAWYLLPDTVDDLEQSFPDLDVMAECRKALGWCKANKAKRKTPGGMPKFLFSWIERAQNDGRRQGAAAKNGGDHRGNFAAASNYLQRRLGDG